MTLLSDWINDQWPCDLQWVAIEAGDIYGALEVHLEVCRACGSPHSCPPLHPPHPCQCISATPPMPSNVNANACCAQLPTPTPSAPMPMHVPRSPPFNLGIYGTIAYGNTPEALGLRNTREMAQFVANAIANANAFANAIANARVIKHANAIANARCQCSVSKQRVVANARCSVACRCQCPRSLPWSNLGGCCERCSQHAREACAATPS